MNDQDSSNSVDQNRPIFYASDAGWWINSECSYQDCCNITRIKAKDQLAAFKIKTNLTLKEIMEKARCTKCQSNNSIRLNYFNCSKKVPYHDARTDVVETPQSHDKATKLAPADEAKKDSKRNHSANSIDDTKEKHIPQNMAESPDRRALIKETAERLKTKKILDEFSKPKINKPKFEPKSAHASAIETKRKFGRKQPKVSNVTLVNNKKNRTKFNPGFTDKLVVRPQSNRPKSGNLTGSDLEYMSRTPSATAKKKSRRVTIKNNDAEISKKYGID